MRCLSGCETRIWLSRAAEGFADVHADMHQMRNWLFGFGGARR